MVVGDFFHEQYQKQQTKLMLVNIRGGGRLLETSAQERQSEIMEMPMPPPAMNWSYFLPGVGGHWVGWAYHDIKLDLAGHEYDQDTT